MKLQDDLQIILQAHTKGYEDGFKRARVETRKLKAEEEKLDSVNKRISKSFSQAANQAGIFLGPLNGLSGRLSSISTAFGRFSAGGLVAGTTVAGLTALTKQALTQFAAWETQMLRQEALLKATGHASGFTGAQLETLAQKQARATLASVQDARSAIGVLSTFRTVSRETFIRTIALAQDMADTFPSATIVSATTQIAKALQDPETGLSALTRTGVTFSEQQKEQIKLWVKEGDLSRAQTAILDELAQQMGGASSAAATGLAGKIDGLSQSYENFLNSFNDNTAAGYVFGQLIATVDKGIQNINESMTNGIDHQIASNLQRIQRLKKAIEEPVTKTFFDVFGTSASHSALKEATAEYHRLMAQKIAISKSKTAEENDVIAKSEKTKAEIIKEKRATELKANQVKGAKTLAQLRSQLGSETELLAQSRDKRLQEINQATIAEAEANKLGFETVEQLKADLSTKANAKYDKSLADIHLRNAREIQANEDKLQKIFDAEIANENRKNALKEREHKKAVTRANKIVAGAEKFNKDLADLEYFYASKQEKIDLDHQTELQKLEALELEKLGLHEKYTTLKKAIDDKYSQEKIATQFQQYGQLGQATAQFANFENQTNLEKFNTTKKMADVYFGAMAGKSKKAFAIQKAFAVAEAVMNTYKMATSSYSALSGIPIVGPILGGVAAAAAIAFGLAQVSQIRSQSQPSGQFHQGIDYVPDTGNYTLLKGERVLDKRLNQDLKQDISNRKSGNAADMPPINFNLSQMDTNGMEDAMRANAPFIYDVVRQVYEDSGRSF